MIAPGTLACSRHMYTPCGTGYAVDGVTNRLFGVTDDFIELALVVAVINPWITSPPNTVVCLLFSRKQRLVFTWLSSVREVEQ